MRNEITKCVLVNAFAPQLVDLQTKIQGPEHPETLKYMGDLAANLSVQGKQTEAGVILQQLCELKAKVLGADHADTLSSMHHYAMNLSKQLQHAEAAALMQQVRSLFGGPAV